MSIIYKIVPSNRKTIFLRNLETTLVNHQILNESKTKYFRNNSCREILDLMENYLEDEKNDSNEQTLNRYRFDCMVLKWFDDRTKLSPNFCKRNETGVVE